MAQHDLEWYVREYDRYLEEFIDTFTSLSKAEFNTPIAVGKWSPGQIVEHLIRSDTAILRLLNGPRTDVPERGPDGKCADIAIRFTVTTTLLPAPPYTLPETENTLSPETTLDAYVDLRSDILAAVDFAPDPGALVTTAAHPMFGELTLTEWLYFSAIHGERHRRQVDAAQRSL